MDDAHNGHICHFCGTYVIDGLEHDVDCLDADGNRKRHWLSDCRPDLVEHAIGETCTWPPMKVDEDVSWDQARVDQFNKDHGRPGCYAYQDRGTLEWGTEHKHFYPDGAM